MRIDRIRVGAFGRLHDFDTGPDALEGLVVVLGPNEAGKSTLFTFLTTALYGFQPATRERNPHVPWGTDEATGCISVRLDADGCVEVERTLRSQPSGRLTVQGRTTDLRNHPVPWVAHVPRTVFRQVFAITLAELAGLDGETWARIQDKMIGSMGATDLLSPRAVAESWEKEAGEIWRPNRRGNQRLRDLQATLRDLRGRRADALARDTQIRRLVDERECVREELRVVRERRQLDLAQVERARSLVPVKRQLDRVAALRAEGGSRDRLRGLPPDPGARYDALRAELEGLERDRVALEVEIGEREATVQRASTSAPLLERRDEIIDLVARAHGAAHARARAVELEGELAAVEARLDAAAPAVLSSSWRDVEGDTLGSVPTERLSERVSGARAAEASTAERRPPAGPTAWVLLGAGVGLLAWGLVVGLPLLTASGAAATAAGVTWRLALTRTGRRGNGALVRTRRADGTDRVDPADLADVLRGIPVRPELLDSPDESLVSGLERVRSLARDRAELLGALDASRERVAEIDGEARRLAASLGRPAMGDAEVLARDLDREIRDAERLHDAGAAADRDLGRLRRRRSESDARAAELEAELRALADRGTALVPGDARKGLELARARLNAHHRADQLEDELHRAHANLEEVRAQIDRLDAPEGEWSVDEEALARARARIEAHEERIEELLTRGEALDAEVGHLRELDTVDTVDSEIESLREEEARLTRERDRKWVLARLLREADRRFREEHQPDLVRRAGSYLGHLTGGRYDRLVVDEANAAHPFHLMGPHLPAPVPLAPPVSTGTLEQAYLSLRLAIVDHLDQGGERLPLFVDEILVNWDGNRRARGLQVLASIADSRQVFVFTCHPAVARELEDAGGRVLGLDGR